MTSHHLATLKRQRAAKATELSSLMAAQQRLRDAEGEENVILAEIGSLGAKEVAAIRDWAEGGGEGDVPLPASQERAVLHSRLVEAQARATAAKGASGAIELDAARVGGEMRDLANAIEDEVARIALRLLAEDMAEANRLVAMARDRLASIDGGRSLFVEVGRQLFASGAEDRARRIFGELERIVGMARASLDPEPGEIQIAARKWERHLAALANDPPPDNNEVCA